MIERILTLSLHYSLGILTILVRSWLAISAVPYKQYDGVGDIKDIGNEYHSPHLLQDSKDKSFRLHINMGKIHTTDKAEHLDYHPYTPYHTEYQ